MKRCLAVFLSFLMSMGLNAQQLPNPYASIGKPMPQMATLSNGVYDEFLHKDSIALINGDVVLRRTGELLFSVEIDSAVLADLYQKQQESFRFLSVDPLTKSYPMLTPYQFASNSPIANIDMDGLEAYFFMLQWNKTESKFQLLTYKVADAKLETIFGAVNANVTDRSFVFGSDGHWHEIPKEWQSKSLSEAGDIKAVFKMINSWKNSDVAYEAVQKGEALQKIGQKAELALGVIMIADGLKNLGAVVVKKIFSKSSIATVSKHLEQFGYRVENEIMLNRLERINRGELTATEIDANFVRHELREQELMKGGMSYDDAHTATLKEQGMYHRDYEKKLYTEEALEAGNAQLYKEH